MPGPSTPAPGAGRGRWLVAIGVAGVAVAAIVAAVLLLGGRQTPEALRYVPADAVIVAELRLELPGDQLQKVGNLLAHFPGFADQSTLGLKLDEAGDRILGSLSNGELSYTADLKPWVGGPAYAALRGLDASGAGPEQATGLVVATTNGAVGCDAVLEDRPTTTETHRGLELRVLADGQGACVADGRFVLLGDPASVRAGLDAHAEGNGVETTERYRAARAALGGDQLATLFVSGEAVSLATDLPGMPPVGPTGLGGASLPDWSIVGVRAEDDALVVDALSAPLPTPSAGPSLLSLPPAHASELLAHVPGDAMVYAELQGASAMLLNALAVLREDPTLGPQLGEIDQVLTAFGGAERLLGWADEAALLIRSGEAAPLEDLHAGVLLLAPDAATAADRVAAYRSLLGLAALGGGLDVSTATVEGIEITTVSVAEGGAPGIGALRFSFAARDRLVVVGLDAAFIRDVLFAGGRTLAEVPEYETTTARSLSPALASVYLSIDGLVATARANLPPEALDSFDADVQPYLTPFDGLHLTAVEDAGASRLRIVLSVSTPPPITP